MDFEARVWHCACMGAFVELAVASDVSFFFVSFFVSRIATLWDRDKMTVKWRVWVGDPGGQFGATAHTKRLWRPLIKMRLFLVPTLTGRRKGRSPFVQTWAETTDAGAEAVKSDPGSSWKGRSGWVGAGVGDRNAQSCGVVRPLRIPLLIRRRGARTDPGETVLEASQLAPSAVSGGMGKAAIANHLHDHADHVSIRQQSQQLAGEAAVPYGVVGCCEIDKHSSAFLAEKLSLMSCVSRVTWGEDDSKTLRSFSSPWYLIFSDVK